MRDKVKDEYFEWLNYMIMGNKNNEYILLCKDLFNVKFRWFILNDVNRAFDGRSLRDDFYDFMGSKMTEYMLCEDANLLEVLIGIALRCEWIIRDELNNLDIRYWFREFLQNLELDLFTDNEYYNHGGKEKIQLILDKFMNRTYSKTGKGGLFPLKFCEKNQRKIELWYQMNFYLVENYHNEDK